MESAPVPHSPPEIFVDKKGHPVDVEPQSVPAEPGVEVDAVWGKLDGNSPNYRNLGWIRAAIIMIKSQVSL
jgi:hypothetical protein